MADITKLNGYDLKDKQLREDILETKMYLGYTDENVIGLLADFENNTFTRLGGAVGKTAGADFNVYNMYGNRKVCAVQDDGTISKWWGEDGYVEDGSIGQIMVRQPKFYYKVVPITIAPIEPDDTDQTDTKGYYLKKVNYYISDKPLPGFKVHPAFIDANGVEKDCYYIGAYEASLYDVSESKYLIYDTWDVSESGGVYTVNAFNTYLADAANDKLCSIAGVKPASGEYSTQFTRSDIETMSRNRGTGWDSLNIKIVSAEQLLSIIEYGQFNMQDAIGLGIVNNTSGSHNEALFTGSTNSIGNSSGEAISSNRLASNGNYIIYDTSGFKAIRYRGVENEWGNIWENISGINVWGNGKMNAGEAYICRDFNYVESKRDDNYIAADFTIPYISQSYPKYFGYSEPFEWFLFASKSGGNSSLPIGDALNSSSKNAMYKTVFHGGNWANDTRAGMFHFTISNAVGSRVRTVGSRLIYID